MMLTVKVRYTQTTVKMPTVVYVPVNKDGMGRSDIET